MDRYFEYLPKKVHEQGEVFAQKFVTSHSRQYARLTTGMVSVKWLLFKCNFNLDTRGDIEKHSSHTHGVNMNRMKREATIKVNESAVLKLAKCTTIAELPNEKKSS